MMFESLLGRNEVVPFQRNCRGKSALAVRYSKRLFRCRSDRAGVEEDLQAIWIPVCQPTPRDQVDNLVMYGLLLD